MPAGHQRHDGLLSSRRNPIWKDAIEKLIQRLTAIAVVKDDYAYMPSGSVEPGADFGPSPMPLGFMAEETSARLIEGLAQYYKVTGYKPESIWPQNSPATSGFTRKTTKLTEDPWLIL